MVGSNAVTGARRAWARYPTTGLLCLAMLGITSLAAALRWGLPATSLLPSCVFYGWTGWHCPGCGGTRACIALAQGEGWLALRCNGLLILGLPALTLWFAWLESQPTMSHRSVARTSRLVLLFIAAFFIVRNVPSPTTSPFAPPRLTAPAHTANRGA